MGIMRAKDFAVILLFLVCFRSNKHGRRYYQYDEDDFFIKVFIVNKLFSNYKLTIN